MVSLNTSPLPIGPSEKVLAGQARALQQLVSGAELPAVFSALIEALEANVGDAAIGSILLVSTDGRRLRHGAAPSLPESYNRAVDGIEIHPDVGTCAAAAARNEVVISTDLASDPAWAAFKHLPLGLGLKSAWSMPIRGADGRVVGTFGTYFRECREPTSLERELVTVLAQTAALAIEHRATETALREEETFLQGLIAASPDCIKVLQLDGRLKWMSANGLCAMEIEDFEPFRDTAWVGLWPEATRPEAAAALAAAQNGEMRRFQGFCPSAKGTPKWWDVGVSLIRTGNGEPKLILCVSRDITDVRQGQLAQKLSEQLAASNARLLAEESERRNAERERQSLRLQLVNAEDEQRRRISRELHDESGQHLTALILGLRALQPEVDAPARKKLQALQDIAKQAVKEIHDLALQLRPTALDDLGLHQALSHLLEQWSTRTGIQVEFKPSAGSAERFPAGVESTVYRIVQEALTNVAKHAGAEKVAVVVERCPDHVLAIVEDNGRGFECDTVLAHGPRGLGLRGMRERAAVHGGAVHVESATGSGTTIFARIPFSAETIS